MSQNSFNHVLQRLQNARFCLALLLVAPNSKGKQYFWWCGIYGLSFWIWRNLTMLIFILVLRGYSVRWIQTKWLKVMPCFWRQWSMRSTLQLAINVEPLCCLWSGQTWTTIMRNPIEYNSTRFKWTEHDQYLIDSYHKSK